MVKRRGGNLEVEGGEENEKMNKRHKEERKRRKQVVIFSNLHTQSLAESIVCFRASLKDIQRNTWKVPLFTPSFRSRFNITSLCVTIFALCWSLSLVYKSQFTIS